MDNWLRMYFMGLIKLTGSCPHWSLSSGDVQRYFFFWVLSMLIVSTNYFGYSPCWLLPQISWATTWYVSGHAISWRQYHIEDGFGDGFVNGRLHCRKAHKLDELDEQHWANVLQSILHGAVIFKRQTLMTVVFRLLWGTTKLLGTPSMISWNRLWCIVMYIR